MMRIRGVQEQPFAPLTEEQQRLWDAFIDAYTSSAHREVVRMFIYGIVGKK
jgi:hypothetical protein